MGFLQTNLSTQAVVIVPVVIALVIIVFLIWQRWLLARRLQETKAQLQETKQNERQLSSVMQVYQAEKNEFVLRQKLTDRLITLARATSGMSTLNDTLKNILRVSSLLTNAEIGSLLLVDAAGNVIDSFSSYQGNMPHRTQEVMEHVLDEGLAGWVMRHNETTLIEDTSTDPRWISLPGTSYQAGSVLCVPISQKETVIGVLTLIHSEVRYFDQEDVKLMQSAADQMALALGNAQIFEGQRRVLERQTTLSELLQTISQQLDSAEVAQTAVETIIQLTGWSMAAIYLADEHKENLVEYAAAGNILPKRAQTIPLSQDSHLTNCWRKQQTDYIKNIAQTYDYVPAHPRLQSELLLPLRQGQRILGVLNVGMDQPYAFPTEDIVLGESMAEATALAIANATLFEAVSTAHGRLDAVIENNANSIIMVGLNKRILVINQKALDQLRLPGTQQDWQGRTIYDVADELESFAPDVAVTLRTETDRIRLGDEEPSEGEFEIPPSILQWSNLSVMGDGQSRGRLYIWRDVTEERSLERMREDLIHTMVHDLRNPLHMIASGISFLTDVLTQDYNIGDNEKQVLEISMANTERLISLVNAILDINQLESGRLPLNYKQFSLADKVEDIFHRAEPRAQEQGIVLRMKIAPETAEVWADPAIIERVLENLIGNALKFTRPHGCIFVKTELMPDAKAVKILVKDNGTGIDPEIRGNIFEKFTTSSRHGIKGNGLGLAFCKMALDAHKQRLWVEESSPQGSTFAFTLALPKKEIIEGTGQDWERDKNPA